MKVQKLKTSNGRSAQVLLVRGKLKNTGKNITTPIADFSAEQKNSKDDSVTLSTFSYVKQLFKDDKRLHDNLNKDLKPGESIEGTWTLKLEGESDVTIKTIFNGKGSIKINVRKLIN